MYRSMDNKSRGFSLLETLVVVVVLVFIVAAIIASITYVYRGQRFAFEQADATRNARVGIEGAVRNMREASTADNGAYPIVTLATSTMTFYSDIDNDTRIERVRYFLDGDELKRGVVEPSGEPPTYATSTEVVTRVAQHVRNTALMTPLFTFFDTNGDTLSNLSDIDAVAFVTMRLVINLEPTRAPNDFELRASAALRNVE